MVLDLRLHNLNKRFGLVVLCAVHMILALHIVHCSLARMLLIMLRAQRDGHQLLQNITAATLVRHSRRLHGINLVNWHKRNLRVCELCAVIVDIFPCSKHRQGSGFICSSREFMRYLKFGQLLRRVGRLMLILKHLHGFLNLSEVLVEAAEVDGALAVVVHDVAAQLPDGPLELVAVELELREPAADALERMQQPLGLLPHALLDGRHDGVLGVPLLSVHVDERPHQLPLVLRILGAAAGLVEGAAGVGGEAEGAGDGGGGRASGRRRHGRAGWLARVLGWCATRAREPGWDGMGGNPKRRKGRGKRGE